VSLKSCGHSFCERCITTWLQGPPAHASCPCCRVAQPLYALPWCVRASTRAVPPATLTWRRASSLSVPNFAARGAVARLRVRCRFAACDAQHALADAADKGRVVDKRPLLRGAPHKDRAGRARVDR
jgi:hypothetical protein